MKIKKSKTLFILIIVLFMLIINFLITFIIYSRGLNSISGNFFSSLTSTQVSSPLLIVNIFLLGILRFFYYIWAKKTKNAQASIEFLMTYGWSILIVAVIIVALFYFNAININNYYGEGCFLGSGFTCLESRVTVNDITLRIRNNAYEDISNFSVVVKGDKNSGACEDTLLSSAAGIKRDGIVIIENNCSINPRTGTLFKSDLNINYDKGTGIIHGENGYLLKKVESLYLSPAQKCSDNTCDVGDNCLNLASLCQNSKCYNPTCANGCGQVAVQYGLTDESCDSTKGCNTLPCVCDGSGGCISAQKCSDNTLYNACSITKPLYCNNGNLINDCNACSCPGGFNSCTNSSGQCYSQGGGPGGKDLYLINTLSDNSPSKNIVFSYNDLSSKTYYFKVLKNSNIVSASFNIIGKSLMAFRVLNLDNYYDQNNWIAADSYLNIINVLQRGSLSGFGFEKNSTYQITMFYSNSCNDGVFYTGFTTPQGYSVYYKDSTKALLVDINGDNVCRDDPQYRLNFGSASTADLSTTSVDTTRETSSLTTNPRIDVAETSNKWTYAGQYSSTQSVTFTNDLINYLISCSPDSNGYCNVPIVLYSNSAGLLEINNIAVTYTS